MSADRERFTHGELLLGGCLVLVPSSFTVSISVDPVTFADLLPPLVRDVVFEF